MNKKSLLRLTFIFSFFITSFARADAHTEVANWTQEVLMETFAVSYQDTPAQRAVIQKNYSLSAWVPMSVFFTEDLKAIREQKLTIHPTPVAPPVVTDAGDFMGVNSWDVNQTMYIPEFGLNVECSLLVINSPTKNGPFLIQSVGMKVSKPTNS